MIEKHPEKRWMTWPLVIAGLSILTGVFASGWIAEQIDLRLSSGPVLRLRAGPITSLDPLEASDWTTLREVGRTYETPLRYQRDSDGGNAAALVVNARTLRPGLLEKMPEQRNRGLHWVLDFKKGKRFHPSSLFSGSDRRRGREITACDWVDSIRRHLAPESRSVWKAYLRKRIAIEGDILCETPWRAIVKLRFHDPEFGYFLAHPAASVLPIHEVLRRNWDLRYRPVGSGAFKLESWGSSLRWRAIDPRAQVRRIEVVLHSDSGTDWSRFRQGKLDLIELPESLRPQVVGADGRLTPEFEGENLQLVKVARSDLLMVGISKLNQTLSTKRGVRLALGLSLTPDEVLDPVFGAGRAVLASGPLPPGVRGYRLDYRHLYRGSDVERARDLLGSNGYIHGHGLPSFVLGCLDYPLEQALCAALKKSWAKVGFRIEQINLDAESRRQSIRRGEIDLWPVTWVADLPAAASYLEIFSDSSETGSVGIPEIPGLGKASAKLEGILDKIRSSPSPVLQQKMIDEALDLINIESPAVFLLHRFQFLVLKKGWKGIGLEDFSWHDSDQISYQL